MLQGFYFGKPKPYSSDEFSEFVIEDARERAYFDQLGSVNLLGLPSDAATPESDYVTESESRSTPMALIECRNGHYRYLSANEAYLKLLEGFAAATLDEVQESVAGDDFRMSDAFIAQLDTARRTGKEAVQERTFGDMQYQMHVRHFASGPDADAFVAIPTAIG